MPPNSRFPDTQSFVAISLIMSIIGLAYTLVFTGKADTDMFKIMVGGLMTVGFANVIGYYFGSSSGSKEKDTAMSGVVERLTPVATSPTNGAAGAEAARDAAAAVAPAAAAAVAPAAAAAVARDAAAAVAPAAAAAVAPAAAAAAAPPAAEVAVPPAVDAALTARGFPRRDT